MVHAPTIAHHYVPSSLDFHVVPFSQPYLASCPTVSHPIFRDWKRSKLKRKHARIMAAENGEEVESSEESGDEEIDGGFKVPCRIWNKLYK